ncbi:hypothetical protein ColTof4_01335 [Colletotrichum tofieldiae]|nr:hypothetical protein ColTof3_08589 [Colletotrichum tofieldiae]GKT68912.1 hypothetical protein ColTof4_01335 [Colletotrichum tofieldiae]
MHVCRAVLYSLMWSITLNISGATAMCSSQYASLSIEARLVSQTLQQGCKRGHGENVQHADAMSATPGKREEIPLEMISLAPVFEKPSLGMNLVGSGFLRGQIGREE